MESLASAVAKHYSKAGADVRRMELPGVQVLKRRLS
jgi:hypothetical protein